jgi:hypothetical protein
MEMADVKFSAEMAKKTSSVKNVISVTISDECASLALIRANPAV